eukprot:2016580-Amphidinium_carterae.1
MEEKNKQKNAREPKLGNDFGCHNFGVNCKTVSHELRAQDTGEGSVDNSRTPTSNQSAKVLPKLQSEVARTYEVTSNRIISMSPP